MTNGAEPHGDQDEKHVDVGTAVDPGTVDRTRVVTVIGFWRDNAEPYWPDVNDYVDESWDTTARAEVVERLLAGRVVQQFRGTSMCRICRQPNGAAELTDGAYVWPEGLAHYVSDHDVRLPQPCEDHFLTAAEDSDVIGGESREADETWWLSLGSPTWH